MPAFHRVLVANRGEIAIRIARSLRELGIEPVMVHTDRDPDGAHVQAFRHAVAVESYLDSADLIRAAKEVNAQAIHPGYGFLSENPDFARAVPEAGLVFIGPGPAAMQTMGSKQHAKDAAIAAGVPVIPGFHKDKGSDKDDKKLRAEAKKIGYPVLIKASGGGGGKGMRLVDNDGDFADALVSCRREAKSAFGDDRVLLEKRVYPARHVEIQVIADQHGTVLSLNERDCSVQRRHQKILEEAPAPGVSEKLRAEMSAAAIHLAQHVNYVNAGTVEFLLGPDGDFYFLEMNTRLQVEHPVTELTTGLDLVELQVRIAAGEKLEGILGPDPDLRPRGHAIEARVYAESPENDYLPAAGTLTRLIEPVGPGIRVDSGVYEGCEVSVHFDPMLSKIIVHAPDRAAACRRLAQALRDAAYLGVHTNVDFLIRVVESEPFQRGDVRTDLLDQNPQLADPAILTVVTPDEIYVAAALCEMLAPRTNGSVGGGGASRRASSPWQTVGPLRLWGAS